MNNTAETPSKQAAAPQPTQDGPEKQLDTTDIFSIIDFVSTPSTMLANLNNNEDVSGLLKRKVVGLEGKVGDHCLEDQSGP